MASPTPQLELLAFGDLRDLECGGNLGRFARQVLVDRPRRALASAADDAVAAAAFSGVASAYILGISRAVEAATMLTQAGLVPATSIGATGTNSALSRCLSATDHADQL